MTLFNFTYDLNVTLQQRIAFEMAAANLVNLLDR